MKKWLCLSYTPITYVTQLEGLDGYNDLRRRYFGDTKPTSTLIVVKGLALPHLKIEIVAMAILPD